MADEKNKNQQGQINIELDEKVAEGTYSNLAIINHSVSEFVVDFVNIMPGVPKNKVKSRIITYCAFSCCSKCFEEQPSNAFKFGLTRQA